MSRHSYAGMRPTALLAGPIESENVMLTTQNYAEKYRELERILAEERKNSEEVKKFYKVLKSDHTRVKTESFELKTQVTNLIEENKTMQEKYKAMFEKMQQELRRKQLYIEELKNRELDEVKLERIKEELSTQIESPYKEIVRQLESELQKLQQETIKLNYDLDFQRSVNEHDKAEHSNYVDQLKLKQEIEMNAVRKERDTLRVKLQESNQSDISKIKDVIRENNQLKIKVRSLIEENDEVRTKIDQLEVHNNSLVRNQSKLVSEYSTKISVLESEKDSLKQQTDSLHKEIMSLNDDIAESVRKAHDFERENTKLKLSMDEIQHTCKRDVANLKLEMVKERGEQNKTKEMLLNQIEDLKLKLEIAEGNLATQRKLIEEKEREITKAMNTVNDDNWSKINELTNEKLEMESKYQIVCKDYEFKLSALQIEKDKSDDMLKAFEKQREDIVRENTKLRGLVGESETLRLELEKEQEKSRELYRKCSKLEAELSSNTGLEQEMTEINLKLKNELSFNVMEIKRLKDQLHRMKDEYETKMSQIRSSEVAEKNDLQFKYDNMNSKYTNIKKFHEQKKKQYQAYARALKQKAESLNAKVRELKARELSVKQMVPLPEYNRLKMQLNYMNKKHMTFRNILMNSSGNIEGSQLQFLQAQLQKPMPPPPPQQNHHPQSQVFSYGNDLFIDPNLLVSEPNLAISSDDNLALSPAQIKNDMNAKIDEITARLDNLANIQSQHLTQRLTTPRTDETAKLKSKSKSNDSLINTGRSSKHESKRDDKLKSSIEVKRLSLSSSSESSISKELNNSSLKSPHKKTPEKKTKHEHSASSSPSKSIHHDTKSKAKSGGKSAKKNESFASSNYEDDFE